jgi:hypothetical protein
VRFITSVNLDASGDYTLTMVNNFPTGDYIGATICTDDAGNAKISNIVDFTVRFCASPPPYYPPANPPQNGVPCASIYNPSSNTCSANGYCAIPEQTCVFIPATVYSIETCGCRNLI